MFQVFPHHLKCEFYNLMQIKCTKNHNPGRFELGTTFGLFFIFPQNMVLNNTDADGDKLNLILDFDTRSFLLILFSWVMDSCLYLMPGQQVKTTI